MLKLTASAGRFVSLLKRGRRWQLQQSEVGLAGDHHVHRRPRDPLDVQRAAPPLLPSRSAQFPLSTAIAAPAPPTASAAPALLGETLVCRRGPGGWDGGREHLGKLGENSSLVAAVGQGLPPQQWPGEPHVDIPLPNKFSAHRAVKRHQFHAPEPSH